MDKVSITIRERCAVLKLHNPPLNVGSSELRADLLAAIQSLEGAEIDAAVIIGEPNFYAGSDIREFDGPLLTPQLPEVISAIEELPIPVVAAISGQALGGGLELAMGCDGRVADDSAALGLPEVTLGIIPGAGGTVRLPRLVGVLTAVEMIASGRSVTADKALATGLIDGIAPEGKLLEYALDKAGSMTTKSCVLYRDMPAVENTGLNEAIERLGRGGRVRPNVTQAMELVASALTMDPAEALAAERACFNELRASDEARNLRYLFFAKAQSAAYLRGFGQAREVRRVGVVGAGTMGAAISALASSAGFDVALFDTNEEAVRRIVENQPEAPAGGSISAVESLDQLQADVVIDAVFEDMEVKSTLFAQLEQVVPPTTIIASNTSYLDLNVLGSPLRHPERFAGFHFFVPAGKNPLLEIVQTDATQAWVVATLGKLARKLGKTAVHARVGEGFIGNRIYASYRTQCEFLLEDGSSVQDIDGALKEFGFPMGPFAVADLSGLDIAWARRRRLRPLMPQGQRYVDIPDRLCEAGRLGRKTGSGWYSYRDNPRGAADPEVEAIAAAERAGKGINTHAESPGRVIQRVLAAIVCAAAEAVRDGIARDPAAIDVVMTEGFAFPKWRGGPLRYASAMPTSWLLEGLAAVYDSCPLTYAIAEPASRGEVPAEVAAVLHRDGVERRHTADEPTGAAV